MFARSQGQLVGTNGENVVRGADGVEHLLSPMAVAVWSAADGSRGVEGLVEVARTVDDLADRERVFAVLDELAAVGLLVERVAPPVAPTLGRRSLFKSLAAGAAAAAVLTPVVASAGQDTCQDASSFKKSEEQMKSAEVQAFKQEKLLKKKQMQQESSYKKAGGKQEQDQKKLATSQEKEEKALLKKADPNSEETVKATESLRLKQEEEVKKLNSAQAEENKKDLSAQEETQKQADAAEAAACCRVSRAGLMEKHAKARAQFGSGPSLVFIDLPGGLTIQADTRLETIVTGSDQGCELQMELLFDGDASDIDVSGVAKTLLAYASKGEKASLQWGTNGEFAATGVFTWSSGSWTGTGMTTGKPSAARIVIGFLPGA